MIHSPEITFSKVPSIFSTTNAPSLPIPKTYAS